MPTELDLDQAKKIVRSRAWGDVTDSELFRHLGAIQDLFQEKILDASWAQICDFQLVTSVDDVSSNGVESAAKLNPWPAEAVRVFVVPTDLVFGLVRMYQLIGAPKTDRIRITREASEAEALVDLERSRQESG